MHMTHVGDSNNVDVGTCQYKEQIATALANFLYKTGLSRRHEQTQENSG